MPELLPYRGDYYLWNYVPSIPAAAIFLVCFLAITVLHCWRLYKTRAWFCLPFAIGCFCEFVGYAARITAASKTNKLMPYIIQNFFILIAPALFAASIYMTLGRIMRSAAGTHHSIIRINWLTKMFVVGDVLSFMIQGGSSGLMFNASTQKIGEAMVVGGLFVQIISFSLFFLCAVIFHIRMRRRPTPESGYSGSNWKTYLYALYVVSVLILARSIFRVVEYLQGQKGYALMNEWTLYIFDSVPMLIVCIIWWAWYPSGISESRSIDYCGSGGESVDLNNNNNNSHDNDGKDVFGHRVQTV